MSLALVDTEIWSFAKKKPERRRFRSKAYFERFLKMHEAASSFFVNEFPKITVLMTLHQLSEIFHVLAFRGTRLPVEQAKEIVKAILTDESIIKVPVSQSDLEAAIDESLDSGIHVWDFLCFLPIKDEVEIVYSCDKHFQDKAFEKYGVKVVNPLPFWIEAE